MKRFTGRKLFLTLVAVILLTASIVIPLSGSIKHALAASRSSHLIAYVNYDDSGFTGNTTATGNIFSNAIIGGPAPTASPTGSVAYNGMTFTPLAKAAISAPTLANFDTLILFEVCDIATSLTTSQHNAINAFLAAGNKLLLYDGDRCAASQGGVADYSWFTFPFATSNPGPQGASGTLNIVENSTLTQGLSSDPFNQDELGDANTATTSDPHWFAAAKTTNALGNNGYFLAYARNVGLIIYDGADHWATNLPTKSLTDLFLNELNQQYDPDNLPGTVPIVSPTPFVSPTPSLTVTPPPTMPHFTPAQKKAFADEADLFSLLSPVYSRLEEICNLLRFPLLVDACKIAFEAEIGAFEGIAKSDEQLAADAPDPNFKVIVQVDLVPAPQVTTAEGFTESEADALNALDNNMLQVNTLQGALLVSINRAQGAFNAGNKEWEARQLKAARQFAGKAAELVQEEPTLLSNIVSAYRHSRFPTISAPGVESFPAIFEDKSLISSIIQTAEALEQFSKN